MLAVFGIGQWEMILLVILSAGCFGVFGFVALVVILLSKPK